MTDHVRYTPEIADAICEQLASGTSMRKICAEPGTPDRRTVERWMETDPAFAAKCARARQTGFDERAELILEEMTAEPDVQRAKLLFEYEKWWLSKQAPKKYGDKTLIGQDPDNPLPGTTDAQLSVQIAVLMAKLGATE